MFMKAFKGEDILEKHEINKKIEEVSKSVLSYCLARTSNREDAEDLAQDILLKIMTSVQNLRNDEAFYGFMWSVAGNVYKDWLRKKSRHKTAELNEIDATEDFDFEKLDNESDVYLLRRELALLNEKHRKATILYYIKNKSCSQIADELSVSESMVKYLLFKSRKILKEGMNMERIYGEQSYNPKGLEIQFLGNGHNRYWQLGRRIVPQNILFACYNDKLTPEQISLEIGVGLPYIEDDINMLAEHDLLLKEGNKYYTNIPIFTNELSDEIDRKTAHLKAIIAEKAKKAILENEEKIRAIGFRGCDMSKNVFRWQMLCIILYNALIDGLANKIELTLPVDKFGTECIVWGIEKGRNTFNSDYVFGISTSTSSGNGFFRFMDFEKISGESVHYNFNENFTNVFVDITKGKSEGFSENDYALVADMVKKGYVINSDGRLSVNAPVFTEEQHKELLGIFADVSEEIICEAQKLLSDIEKIIKNHIPVHIKKLAGSLAYIRVLYDAISEPVGVLYRDEFILKPDKADLLPTTYAVLK